MEFITDKVYTDVFSMAYIRFGHGKNPLVILPGLSIQSMIPLVPVLVKQYEIFTKDFTVYLFDRRKDMPDNYSVKDKEEWNNIRNLSENWFSVQQLCVLMRNAFP